MKYIQPVRGLVFGRYIHTCKELLQINKKKAYSVEKKKRAIHVDNYFKGKEILNTNI